MVFVSHPSEEMSEKNLMSAEGSFGPISELSIHCDLIAWQWACDGAEPVASWDKGDHSAQSYQEAERDRGRGQEVTAASDFLRADPCDLFPSFPSKATELAAHQSMYPWIKSGPLRSIQFPETPQLTTEPLL